MHCLYRLRRDVVKKYFLGGDPEVRKNCVQTGSVQNEVPQSVCLLEGRVGGKLKAIWKMLI